MKMNRELMAIVGGCLLVFLVFCFAVLLLP